MPRASNLYVMCKAPPEQHKWLCACRSAHGLDDSYPADRLHCTLLRLGDGDDWSAAALDRLGETLASVRFDPFDVAFDQIEGRVLRGRKGMPTPAAFHRTLQRRAATCGIALPEHNFWLHMTLAYKGVALADARKIRPIGWRVEDFCLIRSVTGQGHFELGRWSLAERQFALNL